MKLKGLIIALACVTVAVIILFASGVIVTDRSAVLSAEGLSWNGAFYKSCSGYYEESKTIAKTADGNWDINEIEGDPEHNFVVVRSFTDNSLLVRSNYRIPESGNPNTVYLGTNIIENPETCKIFSDIFLNDSEIFSLTATHDDVNKWKSVSIGFDDCSVAIFRGYIGFADGEYFFTVDLTDMKEKDNGDNSDFQVICKSVTKNHYSVLNAYFD